MSIVQDQILLIKYNICDYNCNNLIKKYITSITLINFYYDEKFNKNKQIQRYTHFFFKVLI